ncbi:hypothetical protein ACFE04_008601 [Oxalis oulophora]
MPFRERKASYSSFLSLNLQMGDNEDTLPPSKKRAAGRELSRDNPGLDDDEEDSGEQEAGTFKKASEEVLAARRIVRVRRNQTAPAPASNPFAGISLMNPAAPTVLATLGVTASAPSSNPFAGISQMNPPAPTVPATPEVIDGGDKAVLDEPVAELTTKEKDNKDVETLESKLQDNDKNEKKDEIKGEQDENKSDNKDKKDEEKDNLIGEDGVQGESKGDDKDKKDEEDQSNGKDDLNVENAPLSSFQQLSSYQNAFTGLTGTGFSTTAFSFGSITPKDGSLLGPSSFSFGSSTNGNSSIFNTSAVTPIVSKTEKSSFPAMQEITVETGEENEKAIFLADSILFEFFDGGWKERGKGELKVNISTTGNGKARLLMRAKGNYRLILNASLYPDMKLTDMEKKGVTFACVNSTSEGKDGLSTFALKFKDPSIAEAFRTAVTAHKSNGHTAATILRTPENSPKATDD